MNTNRLARQYQNLTPWERIPLLVAADARGDELDLVRLQQTAPSITIQVPHHLELCERLDDLVKQYLLVQSEAAAWYWKISAMYGQSLIWLSPQEESRRCDRLLNEMKMLCYHYVVRADGWKLVCSQWHLDPEALCRELPGYETMRDLEDVARRLAFSGEEARAYWTEATRARKDTGEECGPAPEFDAVKAAENVAKSMLAFLNDRLDSFGD
jgi:hypothetical protein